MTGALWSTRTPNTLSTEPHIHTDSYPHAGKSLAHFLLSPTSTEALVTFPDLHSRSRLPPSTNPARAFGSQVLPCEKNKEGTHVSLWVVFPLDIWPDTAMFLAKLSMVASWTGAGSNYFKSKETEDVLYPVAMRRRDQTIPAHHY